MVKTSVCLLGLGLTLYGPAPTLASALLIVGSGLGLVGLGTGLLRALVERRRHAYAPAQLHIAQH